MPQEPGGKSLEREQVERLALLVLETLKTELETLKVKNNNPKEFESIQNIISKNSIIIAEKETAKVNIGHDVFLKMMRSGDN